MTRLFKYLFKNGWIEVSLKNTVDSNGRPQLVQLLGNLATAFKSEDLIFVLVIPPPVYQVRVSSFCISLYPKKYKMTVCFPLGQKSLVLGVEIGLKSLNMQTQKSNGKFDLKSRSLQILISRTPEEIPVTMIHQNHHHT